jgi:thymidylate synthase (FAD)
MQHQHKMVNVLDHGFVRLVESMGDDLSIVRNARVSYDAEWRTGEDEGKDEKLIHYLVKNGHTSPLESVTFTFDIKLPIFVCRQWHRHRTWSYNEISARYAELPEEYYVPELAQITMQSETNKQMRTEVPHPMAHVFQQAMLEHSKHCFDLYKTAIEDGIPRELARCLFPVNVYTHMFATVDLHNLLHFIRLRIHSHAQYEIRVYAKALLRLAHSVAPIAVTAFCEANSIILLEELK